jgi:hypothetical protein
MTASSTLWVIIMKLFVGSVGSDQILRRRILRSLAVSSSRDEKGSSRREVSYKKTTW